MKELEVQTKQEVQDISIENISLLLKLLLREGYSFNSNLEIQTAIKNKFNVCVSLDSIEQLWVEEREIEDIKLQMKHLNLY